MEGFCSLGSGSKGNACIVSIGKKKLLIDVGFSKREMEKRLAEKQVDPASIDAILITHEHSDHIKGLENFASTFHIPIFANSETTKAILSECNKELEFTIFTTGETFEYGEIEIHPFSIQHDTLDPVAFTFCYKGIKLAVCTDLGFVTSLVLHHLEESNYLFIESNHEVNMVHACARPQVYKTRVLGRQGHLSNESCAEMLTQIQHKNLKRVILAHLSEECNHPDKAFATAKKVLNEEVELLVADQKNGLDWQAI